MNPTIQALVIGIVAPFAGSIIAYIAGMGAALSWSYSEINLRYAIESGCGWGIVGSILVSCCLLVVQPQRPVNFAVRSSIIWSIFTGGYSFLYIAAIASC